MSVEGCDLYGSEEFFSRAVSLESKWNGRTIVPVAGNAICFVEKYRMERLGMYHKIRPMGGSVGGSIEGKTESDGESSVEAEAHITVKDDQGNAVTVTAGGSIKQDSDGDVKAEGKVKVSVEKEF